MNSTLLKKYETIDQSKVSEKDKKVLEQVKKLTNSFEETDEAKNKTAEKILDQIATLNPDAVKKPQVVAQKVAKAKKVAKTKKPATKPTAKNSGNNIMSVAKEIQKSGESWKDAMERAKQVLKERREQVVQQKKSELEKLLALVRTKKELQGFTKSDLKRDAVRDAKPRGARVVTKEGSTSNAYGTFPNKLGRKYWETRDRHADRLAPNYPKGMPKLASGGALPKDVLQEIYDAQEKSTKGGYFPEYKSEMNYKLLVFGNNYAIEVERRNSREFPAHYYIYDSNFKYLGSAESINAKSKIDYNKLTKADFSGTKFVGYKYANGGGIDGGMNNLTIQEVSFAKGGSVKKVPAYAKKRLEQLRTEIREERISYGEIAELESLKKYIDPNDVELLEWAGVPEFDEDEDNYAKGGKVKHIFEVGQTISYPITKSTKLDKGVKNLFNKYAEKELVIDEIITDTPYNTAKVSLKSTGEKLTGEVILNPRYITFYPDGDGDKKNVKIRDWYMKTYPTDDLGEELNDEVTFEDMWNEDYKEYNIYQVMGVGDSVIRERLFEHLAEIKGVTYNEVYNKMFSSDEYAKGGSVKKVPAYVKKRLEALRTEIREERISTGEIAELESLKQYIDPSDVELLQWAGVPEFDEDEDNYAKGGKLTKSEVMRNMYKPSGDYFFEQKGNDLIVHLTSRDAGNSITNLMDKYDVKDNGRGYHGSSYILSRKNKLNNGGALPFMTDPNFGDFQNTGSFELGGAFMMTDLAGHTGGSDGLGNPTPLSGVSGTHYTGLVGETGAMSSGELFMDGGAMMQNQQVINDASQPYVITEAFGNPAQQLGRFKDGGALESRMKAKLSQNFSLPLQVAVYVPSTKDADETVSKQEFENRVEEVEKFTSSLFGGFSANDVDGGYMSNTKGLIKEEVYKVISFAPKENFDAKMSQLVAQVKKWAKDWGQESIGLEFEGDLFYIEQGGSFAKGGAIKNQYEGRTPEDIWNNLSDKQRKHFLIDHFVKVEDEEQVEYSDLDEEQKEFVDEYSKYTWKDLDWVKIPFKKHVKMGQYASGGSLGKALYVEWSSWFVSNKYDEEKIMSVLESIGAKNIRLENDRGWSNQPEVVVFNGDKNKAQDALNEAFDTEWIRVSEKDWRTKKMADGGGIRSQEELKKIFLEKENLVKNLTPSEIAEMWNKNSYGVKQGISKPMTIEEAKNSNMRMYLENLLIENELTDDEQAKYFAKGGSVDDSVIDELWNGYASAVLFTETDSDSGEPLDSEYSVSDFDKETVTSSKKMLAEFYSKNKEAIEESGLDLDTIGNDIWYTRSGQGAGFFDHSLDEEVEEKLTKGAKELGEYPSVETYDGKISVRGGRVFAKGGFVADVKFEVGDIVWDKGNKRYGTVMNVYGDATNGSSGEIRLDSDGNQPIFTYNKKTWENTGYNLVKLGEKGDTGKFTPAKLAEFKATAKRMIDNSKASKTLKSNVPYYENVYKRTLEGEFDSIVNAKSTAKKSKKDREKELEELSGQVADVWDKIGANSGGSIRTDDKLLKAYAEGTEEVMQKNNIKKGSFDQSDYDYYVDGNDHLFNDFLVFNGYYNSEVTKAETGWRIKNFDEAIKQYGKSQYVANPSIIKVGGKSSSSAKPTKYIDHDDINFVVLKIKGKTVTISGSDVLNGANLLEDGGDLTKTAFYVPRRDVVEVILKNGETVKPVNGYWVLKNYEPITRTSSTTKPKAPAKGKVTSPNYPDVNFNHKVVIKGKTIHLALSKSYVNGVDGSKEYDFIDVDGNPMTGYGFSVKEALKQIEDFGNDPNSYSQKVTPTPAPAPAPVSSKGGLPDFKKGDRVLLKDGNTTREATVVQDGLDSKDRVRVRPIGYPMDISVTIDATANSNVYVIKKLMMGGSYANGGRVGSYEVVIDGDWDEPKKFKTFSLAKKWIYDNVKNHDSLELVDSYGDTIYVEGNSTKEDLEWLFSNEDASFKRGGRVSVNWGGHKSKENWGKNDLYEMYSNSIDLDADLADYFKDYEKDFGKQEADREKKELIQTLMSGKIQHSERESLTFANGGSTGSGFDPVKVKVVLAVGIDEAIEFYNAEYPIRPYQLLERAVRGGYITLEEINRNVVESAMETAQDSEDMEEVGSSDFGASLHNFLDESGFKVSYVNGRLTREFADGGMFDDNGGFMRADNERSFRYPERDVHVDTIDEPIDLTTKATNNVVIRPLDEDIDLKEDGRIRARMTQSNRGSAESFSKINPRAFEFIPMPKSHTHKND